MVIHYFFTAEYLLRAISTEKPASYIFSFFGIIDLISILPLYLSIVFKGEQIVQVVRLLRLIRVFSRILRISHQMDELSLSFLHLKKHLMPNEKVLAHFRLSRKKDYCDTSSYSSLLSYRLLRLFLISRLKAYYLTYLFSSFLV